MLMRENSKAAFRADFALYGMAILAMIGFLALASPADRRLATLLFTLVGMLSWTAIEYLLHRFLLHGLEPFRSWHRDHHRRPRALICASTVMSASLITTLVFFPLLVFGDLWHACALTLGVLIGYLFYALTHHATHHWHARSAWLKRRQRWHLRHHHRHPDACYGVTSRFWDRVFRTLT